MLYVFKLREVGSVVFYRVARVNQLFTRESKHCRIRDLHVCMNVHYFWDDISLSPRHIPLACLSCDVI